MLLPRRQTAKTVKMMQSCIKAWPEYKDAECFTQFTAHIRDTAMRLRPDADRDTSDSESSYQSDSSDSDDSDEEIYKKLVNTSPAKRVSRSTQRVEQPIAIDPPVVDPWANETKDHFYKRRLYANCISLEKAEMELVSIRPECLLTGRQISNFIREPSTLRLCRGMQGCIRLYPYRAIAWYIYHRSKIYNLLLKVYDHLTRDCFAVLDEINVKRFSRVCRKSVIPRELLNKKDPLCRLEANLWYALRKKSQGFALRYDQL